MSKVVNATVRAVRGSRKFTPRKAAVVMTPAAVTRVKQLITGSPESVALKVGVRTRGCNGLSYVLEYAKEKGKFDEEVIQEGARLLIDAKAQLTILGTEMDYVETNLVSEFVFNNPNVKGTCGCGESFTV